MDIYFGLAFDERVIGDPGDHGGPWRVAGPRELLMLLERLYGLDGHPNNNDYLRAEQLRQLLSARLAADQQRCWYGEAFEADALATASALLEMRDELILAGWSPLSTPRTGRLGSFAELEADIQRGRRASSAEVGIAALDPGFADRFRAVIALVPLRRRPFDRLCHLEPAELYPAHLRELFHALEQQGVSIRQIASATPLAGHSDLARFQQVLTDSKGGAGGRFAGDGSLVVMRADRESDAALFLASLLRENPDFRPACVVPEKNRTLENAFLQEGLPALGILSASLARPSLQILKLLPVFFWNPADPYKILEFLSLPAKPLHPQLAREIAALISQRPGLGSGRWKRVIDTFFEQMKNGRTSASHLRTLREQYRRWFERKRYDTHMKVPREDVIECFGYLAQWAREAWEDNPAINMTFLALSSQSKRVCELLSSLPDDESRLTPLQLERIIRTIYEPSPILFAPAEVGALPCAYEPGAIMDNTDDLVWWNFCRRDPQHIFSRWQQEEQEALREAGVFLTTPDQTNTIALWHSRQPVLRARQRLLLFIPSQLNGEEVAPHALNDFLEARFENPDAITCRINNPEETLLLTASNLTLPKLEFSASTVPLPPTPWLELSQKPEPDSERHEYLTQVSNLCYYPHQWVFNRHVKLYQSPILSVARDNTLNGNLGHRLLELLFAEPEVLDWNYQQLDEWIESTGQYLLPREGATLLMYGKEPERRAFFRIMKAAARTLIHHLKSNHWEVVAAEEVIEGQIGPIPFRGRVDLALKRGEERLIIDFKWRGTNYFKDLLRNEEDLQMVLYSKFYGDPSQWPHTAYFILDDAKMVAHNKAAIAEAETPGEEVAQSAIYPKIFERINKTLDWRLGQFQDGFLEIRSQLTARELEDYYQGELLDYLEMKTEDARFDDYLALVNGVYDHLS